MDEFNGLGIVNCAESMLDILSKMQMDTEKLQDAMYEQESLIRGDLIMNQAMELLQEINLTVQKMKTATEKAVEDRKTGATDIIDIQQTDSKNVGRM